MSIVLRINPEYARLADDVEDVLSKFERDGELVFSGRNVLKRFVCGDGTPIVVKRFGHLPLFRRLVYSTICRTKARRAYDNGLKFLERGFMTPAPVAYMEIYRAGVLQNSYFVSLNSDAKALFNELVAPERFDTALANEVAKFMAELHEAGAVHGDPNLNNMLYSRGDDGSVEISVIDTNRSYFRKKVSTRRRLKNLMRVTHRRDLMRQVAGRYAELAGLDPLATVEKIFRMLERFERNRKVRHRIKSIILRRPVD